MGRDLYYDQDRSEATPYKQVSLKRFLANFAKAEQAIIKPERRLIIDAMAGDGSPYMGKKASFFNILDNLGARKKKSVEAILVATEMLPSRYLLLHDRFLDLVLAKTLGIADIDVRIHNGLCEGIGAKIFREIQATSLNKKLSTLIYVDSYGANGIEKVNDLKKQHFAGELSFLVTFSAQFYNRWRDRKGWPSIFDTLADTMKYHLVCPYSEEEWMGCTYHIGRWCHVYFTNNKKMYKAMLAGGDLLPDAELPEGLLKLFP